MGSLGLTHSQQAWLSISYYPSFCIQNPTECVIFDLYYWKYNCRHG